MMVKQGPMANAELKALHEARVARLAASPSHSEVVLGEGDSLTRVKLVEVPALLLFVACAFGESGERWRWRRMEEG